MTPFQSELLAWYRREKRDLPWRRTRDAYSIWVSEIMCQQTTVAAVIPFYERWMARFPTVEALAGAEIDEILTYWQGLGYYRRARYLHAGAQWVVEHGWPTSVEEWRSVPGVGDYTAGAISSISLGLAAPVVDGNVERVYARICADEALNPALKRGAWEWTRSVMVGESPGDWNQALMELGALVCTPKSPSCGKCPVSGFCRAFEEGRVGELPTPKPKKERVELEHVMVVPVLEGKVGLRQIPEGRWWHGMWEVPREESLGVLEDLGFGGGVKIGEVRHVVTKHKILVDVYLLEVEEELAGLKWVAPGDLDGFALPTPVRKALKLWEAWREQGSLL